MTERLPVDEPQREEIRTIRDQTLFVEAGAGSGKTRALVDRIEALVLIDEVPLDSIAAITFTRKAAADLSDRIRERFQQHVAEGDPSGRANAALGQLDGAAVGTLDSFARRILSEHPVEAGVPPGVEVLDELGSQVEFERRWGEFLDQLLDDESMARPLLTLEVAGVRLEAFRSLAAQMESNWDLVEDRLDMNPPEAPPFDLDALLARFDEVAKMRDGCTDDTDRLFPWFDCLATNRDLLTSASDEIDALAIATGMGDRSATKQTIKPGSCGSKANWTTDVGEVRKAIRGIAEDCDAAVGTVTTAALHQLGARIGQFVLDSAEQRRQVGRLNFHDLLVRARRLLRDSQHGPEARQTLRDRYRRLLLDEFQDADPIQIELAVLLATSETDIDAKSWEEISVEPGRLFLVGDPKQSIYRFRRADIRVYLAAREQVERRPALTVNFRTTAPIIQWVNDVFSELIIAEPGSQPEYVALEAHRKKAAPHGPAVTLLGAEPHAVRASADELRSAEASDIAATISEALHGEQPWTVDDGEDGWRQAVASDICILLPTRTSLAALEAALDTVGIPYRTESSSLVYASREVRELMLTLRAVADPTDELATVAALRSFVYGCGDDDLTHWRLGVKGRFSLSAALPDDVDDHPVAAGLRHLQQLHDARLWSTPAELLDRVVRERGVLETAVITEDPGAVWRRLRFVIDQARAWVDAGGVDLRAYLDWAQLQGAANARVSETVLPETDNDSVRIMTVHQSKGLEFPITVLGGMTSSLTSRAAGPVVIFPPTGPAILKLSALVASEEYEAWKPVEKELDRDERLRLLYVAATRARDHLVVSLHRNDGTAQTNASVMAEAALLSSASTPLVPTAVATLPKAAPAHVAVPERNLWRSTRAAALAASSVRTVVAATTLAQAATEATGPGTRSPDSDLWPTWQKGRYGTAVGRAVHGVLSTVDLATGAGLDAAADAHARAEAVPHRAKVVKTLAASALQSAVALDAAAGEHWRELWVAAPIGGCLVEGYVDLLYRTPDGLVVVDWKTDHVDGDDSIAAKLARYRLQGATYAAAVEAAAGEPVQRMVFVFLSESGAIEAELPDLRAAMAEVAERAGELANISADADALVELEQ